MLIRTKSAFVMQPLQNPLCTVAAPKNICRINNVVNLSKIIYDTECSLKIYILYLYSNHNLKAIKKTIPPLRWENNFLLLNLNSIVQDCVSINPYPILFNKIQYKKNLCLLKSCLLMGSGWAEFALPPDIYSIVRVCRSVGGSWIYQYLDCVIYTVAFPPQRKATWGKGTSNSLTKCSKILCQKPLFKTLILIFMIYTIG